MGRHGGTGCFPHLTTLNWENWVPASLGGIEDVAWGRKNQGKAMKALAVDGTEQVEGLSPPLVVTPQPQANRLF